MAQRSKKSKVKLHEFSGIKTLVDLLLESGVAIESFENFFTSYKIEQINKEFDLLKIDKDNLVLDIELKSEDVGQDAIQEQLEQNRYYLKHIAPDVRLYTFVDSSKELYRYTEFGLECVGIENLKDSMQLFENSLSRDIESLFKANSFLISPLNTPEKFLSGDYFLTEQQQNIRKEVMKLILESDWECILGITGKAGTGKTLLLYDIVKEVAEKDKQCCLIHSGILCDDHRTLDRKWKKVDIIPAKDLNEDGDKILKKYQYIFVDESQRIYESTFRKIIEEVNRESKVAVFAYDYVQSLSKAEVKRNIPEKLHKVDGFKEYKLSDKIRTSKEISSFGRTLMNLNNRARGYMDYSNIEVLFANNKEEAFELIDLYKKKEYIFIAYTRSLYQHNSIDSYPNTYNTHHVIGQEYDKVMIMMDKNFRYNSDGRLEGQEHPNPDLLFYKLLYQAISRARENLCILVVENYELFCNILRIKYDMLSRYQYKESRTNTSLSIKKLNRITQRIKNALKATTSEDAVTISETVDMINDELTGAELKKKVVRNGLKLLRILQKELENEDIDKLILEYCDYVEEVTLESVSR